MRNRWRPGETVLVQEIWRGRVWSARPMTAVIDEGDFVALWIPKGTRWKAPTTPTHRRREATRAERLTTSLLLREWAFVDAEWAISNLWLMRAGDWHATWVGYDDTGEHRGWYVNLQEPFKRTKRGFAFMDLMLDIVVDVQGRWRWKDEDELQMMLDRSLLSVADETRIREEAAMVLARVEAREEPFAGHWRTWRPDPTWAGPVLPDGWDHSE